MTERINPTPELLEGILARIPEGFIRRSTLNNRLRMPKTRTLDRIIAPTRVVRQGNLLYDAARLSGDELRALERWCRPELPEIRDDGLLPELPIQEQRRLREQQLEDSDANAYVDMVRMLDSTPGYIPYESMADTEESTRIVEDLISVGVLCREEAYVYDPLRLSAATIHEVQRLALLGDQRDEITAYLKSMPGLTVSRENLYERFGGRRKVNELVATQGFAIFSVKTKVKPYVAHWVRLTDGDAAEAEKVAQDAVKIDDEIWQDALEATGETLRENAREGKTRRSQVVARSYTINRAAKRLGAQTQTIEDAIEAGLLHAFEDPEGSKRIPAGEIEAAAQDPELAGAITASEVLRIRDLVLVLERNASTVRRHLQKANLNRVAPRWGEIRKIWDVPATLAEFREIARERNAEIRAAKAAAREAERQRIEAAKEAERQRIEQLRQRLVAAFPTWQHDGRSEQQITLHIGPPNSGKTHDALEVLGSAGSGWYLAPLRLLAFEIFDRLNRDGIPCNLLTGEERIDVPDAQITAATIEMFNPNNSGGCVIIDEAQMLADSDRGWAWTRAMMEAQSPEIHIIGPQTARNLIEQLAGEAAIPLTVIEHERLAPIKVADKAWPLDQLPPRTILVAFSRQMVLHLKVTLEQMGRTVSVVYGSLPPEVRRKQADRFASGETEICVATDAVGMGLNLPADQVCFYEVEKYDGKDVRVLLPSEVQQIGGRAGRYGLGTEGEVGTTNRRNLRVIQERFYAEPAPLTHARVAPTVKDLEMIPGSLWQRLVQWSDLGSIPDSLRNLIDTANMAERIELAKMLTDAQVEVLGLDAALRLVNAPTRQSTRPYWYSCAKAILQAEPMPLPPTPPAKVATGVALEDVEMCIACADIYLWLAHRREFSGCGPVLRDVAERRLEWSHTIDDALFARLDVSRRCKRCGTRLPTGHRFPICDRCFHGYDRYDRYDDGYRSAKYG